MRSVRVVGSTGDDPGDDITPGTIVVTTEDGERFALTVDDELRTALAMESPDRSDPGGSPDGPNPAQRFPARPAVTVIPLSPRDIQVRVRAGESPEDLADDSGTDIERIMRFAFPVLEERARIGDEARRSRARRDGDGSLVPFGETVDRRFQAHGIDPGSVSWDSFRRPDGTWVVTATWSGATAGRGESERSAHWSFALAARTVLPVDEVGSDLLSDRPLRPVVRAVPDASEEEDPGDQVFDQESPGAYRRAQHRPAPSGQASPEAPPLPLRLAEAPRGSRPTIVPNAPDEQLGFDDGSDIGSDGSDGPSTAPVPAHATDTIAFDELFDANVIEDPVPAEAPEAAPTRGTGRSKASREQTKIPSWDDILLGVRRKQD